MERRERYSLNGGRRSCGSLDGGIPYWSGYKHPLQHTWTLWYLDIVKTRSWSDCLAQIGSFNTIEDFWCLFNHVKPVSLLKHGSDYSLFKDGIRPMWEDSANVNGGRWLINLDKKMSHSKLNEFWLEVAMCMIGECFYGYNDRVCGATINVRNRGHKIGVWLNSSDNEREVIHIGLKLKELLGLSPSQVIIYQEHKDSLEKNGNGFPVIGFSGPQAPPKYTYYV